MKSLIQIIDENKSLPKVEIFKEPHSYNDGTTHFSHVGYTYTEVNDDGTESEPHKIVLATYLNPSTAELICGLLNERNHIRQALLADLNK